MKISRLKLIHQTKFHHLHTGQETAEFKMPMILENLWRQESPVDRFQEKSAIPKTYPAETNDSAAVIGL